MNKEIIERTMNQAEEEVNAVANEAKKCFAGMSGMIFVYKQTPYGIKATSKSINANPFIMIPLLEQAKAKHIARMG